MKPNGANAWAGTAFNPEDGKEYTGKMSLEGREPHHGRLHPRRLDLQVVLLDAREMRRATLALAILAASAGARRAAFDCKKAATPSEKAICADPAALAADAAMSAAFQALLQGAPAPQRPQIAAAQARWLPTRDGACADSKGPALGACLARESDRRRAFLAGQPEAGPGAPGRIAPWFRFEKGGKGRAEVDFELLKFVDPAERRRAHVQRGGREADGRYRPAGEGRSESRFLRVSIGRCA